jgi:hypothetical protein
MNPGHKRIGCVLVVAGLMLSTAQAARADVVLEWNAIAMRTLTTQKPIVNSFAQARFAAIIQLAVFEAVNAVTGEYESYLGAAVAPARAPIVAAAGASSEAAAIAAAHAVLTRQTFSSHSPWPIGPEASRMALLTAESRR